MALSPRPSAKLLAHAHALAHEIEALRRGPPQALLRRDGALLVLEALIGSEILEGLEALERSTRASRRTALSSIRRRLARTWKDGLVL